MAKKKSEKELKLEKVEQIMLGVATWASYYRNNPQRFVKEYLNVTLKRFQKILIYAMMHNNHVLFWACRSLGKTWLTALYCICRCVLYPRTKIIVASGVRSQGNQVLLKIRDDFMKNYGWGSENLRREILDISIGAQKAECLFKNGSFIRVVTASDSARGERGNVLICDEVRLIPKDVIDLVLKRFLGSPRQPGYLSLPEYEGRDEYVEQNIEISMSSAYLKQDWTFEKSKAYTVNMLGGRPGYFICALPYQLAVKEGLKKRVEIEDEMSESDFDATKFMMEMECVPLGSDDGAFYDFDSVDKRRTLKSPIYPPTDTAKMKGMAIPELAENERRIMSVDIALMASTAKSNNDATSIIINRAKPISSRNGYSYHANIIYLKNYEGVVSSDLSLIIRRLFDQYKCTDLVVDYNGPGIAILDNLLEDIIDPETGVTYPALNVRNNDAFAERCKSQNAIKCIWAIKATAEFNNDGAILLRNAFQTGKINLLMSDNNIDAYLKENIVGYNKMTPDEQSKFRMPYVQTTLLVYELVSLEYSINGTNIKLKEKSGNRKDRFSSLMYNYWVMNKLEEEILRKQKEEFNASTFARMLGQISQKPISY